MAPSIVWTYFKKTSNGEKVKCTICDKDLTFKNSTSTLRHHLELVHNVQMPQTNLSRKRQFVSNNNENDQECDNMVPPKKKAALCESPSNGPLDKCFTNTTSFLAGGHRHEEVTTSLMYMIVKDNLSFSTPEKKGFKLFIKKLQPLYHPPSEPTLIKSLEAKYEELKIRVKNEIKTVDSICLTSDIWTHKYTMKSYLGITAHYLKGTEMMSIELGAYLMEDRKNINNIRKELRKICNEWGISDESISAVVTDSGANIKDAVKQEFGDGKHISCFGHVLNNIGQRIIGINIALPPSECSGGSPELPENENELNDNDEDDDDNNNNISSNSEKVSLRELLRKVKRIVRFFRTSEIASTELRHLQKKERPATPTLNLINEVKTRWNSCYDMLERFLKLVDPVSRVLFQLQRDKSSRSKPPMMLTADELEALSEVKDLLKPLWRVTLEISSEKCVTLSKCIPVVKGLLRKTSEFNACTSTGFNLKEKLITELNHKFSNIEAVKLYALATILDPRYKKNGFQNDRESARAIQNVGDLTKNEIRLSKALESDLAIASSDQTDTVTDRDDDDIWSYLDDAVLHNNHQSDTDEAGGLPIQLRQYLTRPAVDRRSNPNPFVVWESMKVEYPHIWSLAKKFLPIMATSVPCERLFSHAGIIASQKRSRLSPKHLNMLVFLRSADDKLWFK